MWLDECEEKHVNPKEQYGFRSSHFTDTETGRDNNKA